MPLAGGLAATCLVLLAVGRFAWLKRADDGPVPAPPIGVVVELIDPAEELTHLAAAVDRLDERVQQLKEQAARQEALREVAAVLDRFGRW